MLLRLLPSGTSPAVSGGGARTSRRRHSATNSGGASAAAGGGGSSYTAPGPTSSKAGTSGAPAAKNGATKYRGVRQRPWGKVCGGLGARVTGELTDYEMASAWAKHAPEAGTEARTMAGGLHGTFLS